MAILSDAVASRLILATASLLQATSGRRFPKQMAMARRYQADHKSRFIFGQSGSRRDHCAAVLLLTLPV
jgi:hypothetical protein